MQGPQRTPFASRATSFRNQQTSVMASRSSEHATGGDKARKPRQHMIAGGHIQGDCRGALDDKAALRLCHRHLPHTGKEKTSLFDPLWPIRCAAWHHPICNSHSQACSGLNCLAHLCRLVTCVHWHLCRARNRSICLLCLLQSASFILEWLVGLLSCKERQHTCLGNRVPCIWTAQPSAAHGCHSAAVHDTWGAGDSLFK